MRHAFEIYWCYYAGLYPSQFGEKNGMSVNDIICTLRAEYATWAIKAHRGIGYEEIRLGFGLRNPEW